MALNAGTIWEVRTDGANTNGGGFYDRNPGTSVDYSQQAAAQLALSDIATDGAGTGLSSVTGGFTAAMAGNIIYLTGGGSTAGWYEITAVADTNNCTIDRSAGLSLTGITGNVGGAFAFGGALDDEFMEAVANGNTVYIKSGTHTLGENTYRSANATQLLPVSFIGYDTDRAIRPTGDNRPLIACGSYYWGAGSYISAENLRFTGTGIYVVDGGFLYAYVCNCKAENSSGIGGRHAFYSSGDPKYWGCEGVSTKGNVFSGGRCSFCYAHDSNNGFNTEHVVHSVADTCTGYGVYTYREVIHTTIYNCGTGVHFVISTTEPCIVNSIIHTCTTAVDAASESDHPVVAYCTLYNNGTDFGANVDECRQFSNRSADPGLNDPANGDFSITSADDVYQQALSIETYISGVELGDPLSIGVAQTSGSAGGGLLMHPGMTGGISG